MIQNSYFSRFLFTSVLFIKIKVSFVDNKKKLFNDKSWQKQCDLIFDYNYVDRLINVMNKQPYGSKMRLTRPISKKYLLHVQQADILMKHLTTECTMVLLLQPLKICTHVT